MGNKLQRNSPNGWNIRSAQGGLSGHNQLSGGHLPPTRTLLPGGEAAGVRVAIDRQARLVAPQHVRLGRRLAQCQVFHCKQITSQRLVGMFGDGERKLCRVSGEFDSNLVWSDYCWWCLMIGGTDSRQGYLRSSVHLARKLVDLPPPVLTGKNPGGVKSRFHSIELEFWPGCRCRRPAPPGRTSPRRRAAFRWLVHRGDRTPLLVAVLNYVLLQTIIFNSTLSPTSLPGKLICTQH